MEIVITAVGPDNVGLADPIIHYVTGQGANIEEIQMYNHDEEALFHVVNRGARYVGLIGSRRKIRLIFDDLLEQGIPREALERVYAPLGIDIGSQTVPEIAVSIAAELVAARNREGFIPGRPERVELAKQSS